MTKPVATYPSDDSPDIKLLYECRQANHFGIVEQYKLYLDGTIAPEFIIILLELWRNRMQGAAQQKRISAYYADLSYTSEMDEARSLSKRSVQLDMLITTIKEKHNV